MGEMDRLMTSDLRRRTRASVRAGMLAGLAPVVLMTAAACAPAGATGGAPSPGGAATSSAEAAQVTGHRTSHPVTTVVLTDDPAVVGADGSGGEAWPELLADELEDAGGLSLRTVATEEAGFAAAGASSFAHLVRENVVHETQLVVLYDRGTGSADAASILDGARDALKILEEQSPDGMAVLITPSDPSADVLGALEYAVRHSEVTVAWIDPAAEGWPDDPEQQDFADRLHDELADVVESLATSGAFD